MIFVTGDFFNNFANLLKLRNCNFQGLISVTASVLLNYFAIFERINIVMRPYNSCKSISFSKSKKN